jgi:hypothetical protein
MFRRNKGLKPAQGYEIEPPDKNRSLKYGNGLEINIDILMKVIVTDYLLREILQAEEYITRKFRISEKKTFEEEKVYETELQTLRRTYMTIEHTESMIPLGPLRKYYDSLRQDPVWYLRRELVQDCITRGGCCSRGCGCCKNRLSTTEYSKGIGHCTAACYCCSAVRGSDYHPDITLSILSFLRPRLEKNPAYFIEMVEAYFPKPEDKTIRWKWWR